MHKINSRTSLNIFICLVASSITFHKCFLQKIIIFNMHELTKLAWSKSNSLTERHKKWKRCSHSFKTYTTGYYVMLGYHVKSFWQEQQDMAQLGLKIYLLASILNI
ncbi:hypothetical protein J1N35_027015 [Gossypium stocksii]|uniref:Uncharacterized protein n=1 Tax=Gossypium stocksii TaxID=47602 RepID=A0A9D3ZYQ7_9ROSI|nr:hypothetical protein J1N35_027015 [Gossypium stocksii]